MTPAAALGLPAAVQFALRRAGLGDAANLWGVNDPETWMGRAWSTAEDSLAAPSALPADRVLYEDDACHLTESIWIFRDTDFAGWRVPAEAAAAAPQSIVYVNCVGHLPLPSVRFVYVSENVDPALHYAGTPLLLLYVSCPLIETAQLDGCVGDTLHLTGAVRVTGAATSGFHSTIVDVTPGHEDVYAGRDMTWLVLQGALPRAVPPHLTHLGIECGFADDLRALDCSGVEHLRLHNCRHLNALPRLSPRCHLELQECFLESLWLEQELAALTLHNCVLTQLHLPPVSLLQITNCTVQSVTGELRNRRLEFAGDSPDLVYGLLHDGLRALHVSGTDFNFSHLERCPALAELELDRCTLHGHVALASLQRLAVTHSQMLDATFPASPSYMKLVLVSVSTQCDLPNLQLPSLQKVVLDDVASDVRLTVTVPRAARVVKRRCQVIIVRV